MLLCEFDVFIDLLVEYGNVWYVISGYIYRNIIVFYCGIFFIIFVGGCMIVIEDVGCCENRYCCIGLV